MKKKALGIIAASAFAIAAISGPVAAKPGIDPGAPYCFGQVHKAVNSGLLSSAGIDNVGQLVQSDLAASFGMKGQGKNAIATSVCTPS
jgi:hypothetical protein